MENKKKKRVFTEEILNLKLFFYSNGNELRGLELSVCAVLMIRKEIKITRLSLHN